MRRFGILTLSHAAVALIGFVLGVYLLPILTAPPSPEASKLQQEAQNATFQATFTRDLKGSDFLHWGEGTVSLLPNKIIHEGKLAPGPDYKVYLTKSFAQDKEAFLALKAQAQLIGEVKSFNGFILDIPEGVNVSDYTTVVVWCEAFNEFITAAKYR